MAAELKRYRLRHRTRPLDVLVAGEGPPLVLVHGWALSGKAYEAAILALADQGYRVAAPWVAVHHDWTIEAVAETTAEAMAGVEAAPAPIVGHSFGGVVAAQVTLQHTDFVTAMIPVNAPLVSLGSLRLGRIMLPGRHYGIMAHGGAARSLLRSVVAPSGIPSLLRSARWFLGSGHDAPLPAIADLGIPRAVVWAADDAVVPDHVGRRAAELLDCPFVLIEGEGARGPDHDWPFRDPQGFADVIAQVLRTDAIPRPIPGDETSTTA